MFISIKDHLKNLNVLYLALIAGQVLICGIFLFLTIQGKEEATSHYIFIGPLLSIATITAAFMLYNTHKKQAKKIKDEDEKLLHHRSTNIIRWALLEGGNLINVILFFLEGNYIYLLFFAMGLLAFLMLRPTEKAFKEEYGF